jgi:predicted nucleotidyltransferase component of viral defense system
MTKNPLTGQQQAFVEFFANAPPLRENFYFSGGTALSAFYLRHRFSEDLDFFSENEFDVTDLTNFLLSEKEVFGARDFTFARSFNRNLFFITGKDGSGMKVEFTYYPFKRLKKGLTRGNIQIDSVFDIAVNKVFTMSQHVRGRDFYDIFAIHEKYGFEFRDLVKNARLKFDYPINLLQLGKNLLKAADFFDDPILLDAPDKKDVENYFLELAKNLGIFE